MNAEVNMIEVDLRRRCGELCQRFNGISCLKTISIVGAYDAVIGGHLVDSRRLTDVLNYLIYSGFPIDPDFEIDVVNFREGRDFLIEENQADLVFVSNIISGTHSFLPKFFMGDTKKRSLDDLCVTVSRINDIYDWHERLEVGKTKCIVTFGGIVEVSTQMFNEVDESVFSVLIPSPIEECGSSCVVGSQIKPLYPTLENIDLPQGWLGFAAQRDFIRAILPALNLKSCLGQEALRCMAPQ